MENNSISIRISKDELIRQILVLIYQHKEINLNELSQETETELSDLVSIIELIEKKGFVRTENQTIITEESKISLQEGKNFIIGLDLGGTKLYGAISDIVGDIIYEKEITNHGKSGEACFGMIVDLINGFIDESTKSEFKLIGIGVDVPGLVQLDTGLVINAPAVNFKEFPLKERLVSKFGLPTYIDNDLKQASIGEAWFGAGKYYRNVVLLSIGTGIAASHVIDGKPLRGGHFRHGELGWMVPGREFLGRAYEGFGALEIEASGLGIEKRASRLLKETENELLLDGLDSARVFKAAQQGEYWAKICIDETVDYLAVLIANIMAFYDPDIIILSGGVSRAGDMLIPPILDRIEGCVLTQPTIRTSSLGYRAGVFGAIINLIQNCPEIFQ
jgi:glucokinase